jgi:hypothetical protein
VPGGGSLGRRQTRTLAQPSRSPLSSLAPVAEIVVSRPAEGYVDRLRRYEIVVDDETLANLRRGDEVSVPVTVGHHRVHAKIDWGRSQDLDLDLGEDDRAFLLCQPGFAFSLLRPTALLYMTIWRKRYLALQLLHIESAG